MWSLRRKKDTSTTKSTKEAPQEVKDYYRAEKRDRLWGVWLLSLATFFGTLIVVFGLFWGGRWIYRQATSKDKPETVSTGAPSDQPGAVKNGGTSSDLPGTNGSAPSNPQLQGSKPSTTTPPASTPATPAPSASTPPATSQLINTGPTSDE